MKLTRREVVKGGVATFTLGFVAPALLTNMASAQVATSRNTVIIDMDGGLDGLSVLVPYEDPFYYNRRPTIAVPAANVLQIGKDGTNRGLGLHPRLTGLKGLFDQGKMAIIQRVGYTNSSRSHFTGLDIWSTADPSNDMRFGWLGRYLDTLGPLDPLYAWNGTPATPRLLLAPIHQVPAIPSTGTYNYRTFNTGVEGALEKAAARRISSHVPVDRPHVALVQRSMGDALATVDRVQRVGSYTASTGVTYPTTGLGPALRTVAGAIVQQAGAKVFFVRIGGFDTHAGQQTNAGYFFNLMANFNDAVTAFYQDLQNRGVINDTLVMTFSEFGRRVGENSSNGCDHGAGNPIMVLGGSVRGGIYGTQADLNPYVGNPTLESRDLGDVRHAIDFRSLYARVADNWLQTDSVALLQGNHRSEAVNFI